MCDSLGYGTGKYIDIPAFLLIEGNEEYQGGKIQNNVSLHSNWDGFACVFVFIWIWISCSWSSSYKIQKGDDLKKLCSVSYHI